MYVKKMKSALFVFAQGKSTIMLVFRATVNTLKLKKKTKKMCLAQT